MEPYLQQILIGVLFLAAVGYMVWRSFRSTKEDCGPVCGKCGPETTLKKQKPHKSGS
jgi:hypothetical protein